MVGALEEDEAEGVLGLKEGIGHIEGYPRVDTPVGASMEQQEGSGLAKFIDPADG